MLAVFGLTLYLSCCHWHDLVHFACSQLEENICSIALSSDWLKLMDDWLIEHSIFQSAPVTVGATQKRKPGKRRLRNQPEITAQGSDDDSFTWWRGGRLSKVILLKAVLSKPKIRKAAWQGNCLVIFFVLVNNSYVNIQCFLIVFHF